MAETTAPSTALRAMTWPLDPVTGRAVIGARAGRQTMLETVEKIDARLEYLRALRYRLGCLLVGFLDRLADGDPVEPVAIDLVRAVDRFAGRPDADQ